MNGNLIKVMAIFVFFGFAECAAGSCLNYGHACWGAHGKRSQPDDPGNWFLSRLVQNSDDSSILDNNRNNHNNVNNNDPESFQREQERRMDEWNQLADERIFNDGQYERIRLPKLLNKRSPPRN